MMVYRSSEFASGLDKGGEECGSYLQPSVCYHACQFASYRSPSD
uniref:Uncharacterized protein n=1 Tax=Picea glauca TaxID=3330 RepID=A0A117NJ87_PICGL|nr:hypothetical protein ABT39_MTgene1014 [Picea glauca]